MLVRLVSRHNWMVKPSAGQHKGSLLQPCWNPIFSTLQQISASTWLSQTLTLSDCRLRPSPRKPKMVATASPATLFVFRYYTYTRLLSQDVISRPADVYRLFLHRVACSAPAYVCVGVYVCMYVCVCVGCVQSGTVAAQLLRTLSGFNAAVFILSPIMSDVVVRGTVSGVFPSAPPLAR